MYEHGASLIKSEPKDPVDNNFNYELKQEENLRNGSQNAQKVNFREIIAIRSDIVQ